MHIYIYVYQSVTQTGVMAATCFSTVATIATCGTSTSFARRTGDIQKTNVVQAPTRLTARWRAISTETCARETLLADT